MLELLLLAMTIVMLAAMLASQSAPRPERFSRQEARHD